MRQKKQVIFFLVLLSFVAVCLIIYFCDFGNYIGNLTEQPRGEIVFVPAKGKHLGFTNVTGKDIQIIDTEVGFMIPVWGNNGNSIFGLGENLYFDHPTYWNIQNGVNKRCANGPYYFQIIGTDNPLIPTEAIVNNYSQIILVQMDNCIDKTFLVAEDHYPEDFKVLGMSFNSDSQELLFGVYRSYSQEWHYEIVKLNLNTKNESFIGYGLNPSWSSNGDKIAYFGEDGKMYLMEKDGSNIRLINTNQFFTPNERLIPEVIPIIQWSPDDQWIVYHRCTDEYWRNPEKCQIYKMNMETLEETLLIDQGMFPDWKPISKE